MIIRPGTSIIEIVIATALISVSIISALSLANHTQKQNTYAKNLAQATKYTTQAADWIRTERNSLGWATLAAKDPGSYCLNTLPSDFTLIQGGTCADGSYLLNTQFKRDLTIQQPNPQTLKFIIEVSWQEQVARQATLELELTQ